MNQNQIAEPVKVRVAVVGASGAQAPPTSNTGAPQAKATVTFVSPLFMAVPSIRADDPALTGKP